MRLAYKILIFTSEVLIYRSLIQNGQTELALGKYWMIYIGDVPVCPIVRMSDHYSDAINGSLEGETRLPV